VYDMLPLVCPMRCAAGTGPGRRLQLDIRGACVACVQARGVVCWLHYQLASGIGLFEVAMATELLRCTLLIQPLHDVLQDSCQAGVQHSDEWLGCCLHVFLCMKTMFAAVKCYCNMCPAQLGCGRAPSNHPCALV
jgi:hypothetical protein